MISERLGLKVATTSAKPTRWYLRPKRRCGINSLIIEHVINCDIREQVRPKAHSHPEPRNWKTAFRDETLGCGASIPTECLQNRLPIDADSRIIASHARGIRKYRITRKSEKACRNQHSKPEQTSAFDAVIVGAGFAGMYMLHRLRGIGLSVRVFEAGSGVGGTWYWNRYPGARCDVESMQYSYQFSEELQQEWVWSERYAPQPEILRYANHVADRFDLRRDIRFNTRVHSAVFDEVEDRWVLEVGDGERVTATYSSWPPAACRRPICPKFAGIDSFQGETYHTGHWPHEGVDFSGKRVGIIGTGSSAIQSIPIIAQQAAHLYVFQRTPNYTIPAHNGPLDPAYQAAVKADYAGLRARAKQTFPGIDFNFNMESALAADEEERQHEFEKRWTYGGLPFIGAFGDLLYNQAANDLAAEFVRGKIREIVHDPEVAEMLSPRNVIGCKRLCVDTGYWETYNRPNVTLIDVSGEPIEAITPAGIRAKGQEYAVDAIVFATGFDAMTGALLKIDIRGTGGQALKEKWRRARRRISALASPASPTSSRSPGRAAPQC